MGKNRRNNSYNYGRHNKSKNRSYDNFNRAKQKQLNNNYKYAKQAYQKTLANSSTNKPKTEQPADPKQDFYDFRDKQKLEYYGFEYDKGLGLYVDTRTGEYLDKDETEKAIKVTEQAENNFYDNNYDNEPISTPKYENNFKDYETAYNGTPLSDEIIVRNFKDMLNSLPRNLTKELRGLTNSLIHEDGIEAVSEMLQSLPQRFKECLERSGYDSKSAINEYATQMINYMPISEGRKEGLMDRFEFHELGYEIEDED